MTYLFAYVVGCGSATSPPDSSVEYIDSSVVWIDPNEFEQGPTLDAALSDELLARIRAVHDTFADVDGTPLEKWIDDFKLDLDRERSIRIWEDMQETYNAYGRGRELPLATRKEVFKIVLMRSMMPVDDVLARIELEQLSVDDVRKILAAYPSEAKPIDVIQAEK